MTGSQGVCGGVIVYGRSDATLKPGGVRIGTAEIYRIVENLPEVTDSLVIGQPWRGDIRVVLYIKLKLGFSLDNLLKSKIRNTLQTKASAKHAPGLIIEVDKIPYTRSGKKVELAVKKAVEGQAVLNRDALKNPGTPQRRVLVWPAPPHNVGCSLAAQAPSTFSWAWLAHCGLRRHSRADVT